MPLTTQELLLKDSELEALTRALANFGIADPIGQAALEAEELFVAYTARYTVPTSMAKRLQRALIIYQLYSQITAVNDAVQKAYEEAMKTLRDIRDGKFKSMAEADGIKLTGNTGSADVIPIRM
jgi:hypothetical protein